MHLASMSWHFIAKKVHFLLSAIVRNTVQICCIQTLLFCFQHTPCSGVEAVLVEAFLLSVLCVWMNSFQIDCYLLKLIRITRFCKISHVHQCYFIPTIVEQQIPYQWQFHWHVKSLSPSLYPVCKIRYYCFILNKGFLILGSSWISYPRITEIYLFKKPFELFEIGVFRQDTTFIS